MESYMEMSHKWGAEFIESLQTRERFSQVKVKVTGRNRSREGRRETKQQTQRSKPSKIGTWNIRFVPIWKTGQCSPRDRQNECLVLDKIISRSVVLLSPKNDRILLVKTKASPVNVAYTLTADAEDQQIDIFNNSLDELFSSYKSNEIMIVMGEFNANAPNHDTDYRFGAFIENIQAAAAKTIPTHLQMTTQILFDAVMEASEHLGLHVNSKKTNYMEISKPEVPPICPLKQGEVEIQVHENVSYTEIFRRGQGRELLESIRAGQHKFLGHAIRKGTLEDLWLSGKTEGKQAQGRPRLPRLQCLQVAMVTISEVSPHPAFPGLRSVVWQGTLCIAGDRPYWWVHETPVYAHRRPPVLMQYPRTCETGPGMPSGHAKLNAAMFYILVSAFNEMVVKNTTLLSQKQRVWATRGLWAAYGIWMTLVLISRTYIAAHFPHQCVAGALIGLMMAMMVSRMPVLQHLTRRQYVALSVTIIVSVLGIYFSVRTIGGNVLWSLEKAIKWCVKREYIHIDSTPFYSFSRYSGVSLGLGLGLSSPWFKKAAKSRFSTNMIASLAVLNFVTSQIGVVVHKSLSPAMFGWYVAEFTLNCTVTFMLVAALPNFVRVVYNARAGDKYKKK
ncbi:uncharacterized protein LOC134764288 [Penaeus indicus]|uniref:uncharacterized protein LOC134764288 n=1 Tax=Penaeus indicus TaxID=29960 RepID=UPI00300CB676